MCVSMRELADVPVSLLLASSQESAKTFRRNQIEDDGSITSFASEPMLSISKKTLLLTIQQ